MLERDIKKLVKEFFKKRYYVPEMEFNVGVRPDVVAFRWVDEYEIEAIAVECKAVQKLRSLTEIALTQAREYQVAFPQVYLATPKPRNPDALKKTLEALHMGLLIAGDGECKMELKAGMSPRLVYDDFCLKVRQRAVAIMTFRDTLEEPKINVREPELVACWNVDQVNWLLSTFEADRDFYFGICIEKKENVEKTLGKMDPKRFHRLLPEDYLVQMAYIDTYKPREVHIPLLAKTTKLTADDARWIKKYGERKGWKIRLTVMKKVWQKYELLSKTDHRTRIENVKNELNPLHEFLQDQTSD